MPRPKKQRLCQGNVCGRAFKPTGAPLAELPRIVLQRDELEALRLCDMEGLFQEEAGERMGVSRGTVQRLLAAARRKVATALTQGAALIIEEERANLVPPPAPLPTKI
ncbi:MAG TPA: DUF134 domain-containing protein [Desulfurivibrionaceae bacterium]|nr:DUF134 domain-containing protein [Desulfurivibrionaceae bacterium]